MAVVSRQRLRSAPPWPTRSLPSKKVHIKRNFTLTVARCMGVIIPGDFKVVHTKRYFALNVFVLTRFHCTLRVRVRQTKATPPTHVRACA